MGPIQTICLQGRTLSGDDLRRVRALIAQHPEWHRTALSRELCLRWNWRNGAGRFKDMAARTLLLKLQARGLIELPPAQTCTARPCAQAPPRSPPHLASHLLGLAARRLSADWQARYGHPVWLAETFVEGERFAGTAYKAAGWLELGLTTGRTRQDRERTLQSPRKSVWVRPLHPAFRQRLTTP